MRTERQRVVDVMAQAIMKHAGLSDFDRELVDDEVESIMNALSTGGFVVLHTDELGGGRNA